MPKGDLLEFVRSEVRGVVYHNSILDEMRLGGRNYPRTGRYLIEVDEPQLDELYLTIVSILNEPVNKVMWKVSIDGLNITREFKPQVVNESSIGSIYATHVFDLSKIVRVGKTYALMITFDSSKPVIIDGIELIGVRRVEGVLTEVSYMAGCVLLNPSEAYSIKPSPSKPGPYNLSLFMNVPSRSAAVDITLNNMHLKTLNGLLGLSNVQLPSLHLTQDGVLIIKHKEATEMYHPRFISIYSLLNYSMSCRGPEVTMTLDEISCKGDECNVSIIIRNEGDLTCDNVMVVGFSAGNILIRDVINAVRAGEEVRKNYRISARSADTRVVLKAIYRRFGRQFINEVKASLPSNG
ncbi:MAG: hypothetical protein QXH57_02690 [Sulfolobales archaeon]